MVLFPVVAFLLSAWLTRRLLDPASPFVILDHPNDRSLHEYPTPRVGGLAILTSALLAGSAATLAMAATAPFGAVLVGTVAIAGVSILDDRTHVPAFYRLAVHLAAAALTAAVMLEPLLLQLPPLFRGLGAGVVLGLGILAIAWMINLYNFMDGMDGFAGGMAVIGFSTLALFGWMAGDPLYVVINLVVAGAAAGFLLYNFPPARIFMGDVGSSVLGYWAAFSSLLGISGGLFPAWVPILLFAPFIADATVTLLNRLFRGEAVWRAHRTHYYQRLVLLGWGHRRTVLLEYGLMFACAASAVLGSRLEAMGQWLLLGMWILAYGGLMAFVSRLEIDLPGK